MAHVKFDQEISSESERRKYKASLAKSLNKYKTLYPAMAEGGVVQYGKYECPHENGELNSNEYKEDKIKREEFLQKNKEFNFLHQKIKIIVKRLKDYEDAMAVAKMNKLNEPRASQD